MYLAWYGRTADFLPHDVHEYISSTFARVKDDDRHYRRPSLARASFDFALSVAIAKITLKLELIICLSTGGIF